MELQYIESLPACSEQTDLARKSLIDVLLLSGLQARKTALM